MQCKCTHMYIYACFAICVCVAESVIFTCRLVEVCDARMGVARKRFVVNGFGPVRNSRLSVLMVDKG